MRKYVQITHYWSSTTAANLDGYVWVAHIYNAYVGIADNMFSVNNVWPVRGGH